MKRVTASLPDSVYQLIRNEADEYGKSMSDTIVARIMANASGISKNMYRHIIAEDLFAQTEYKRLEDLIQHDSYNLSQVEYELKYKNINNVDISSLKAMSKKLNVILLQLSAMPRAVDKRVHSKKYRK